MSNHLRSYALLIVALLLFGCAAERHSDSDLTLREALRQVETLPVPAGADAQDFAQIKAAFSAALLGSGQQRFVSALPAGDSGTVSDLYVSGSSASITLEWTYVNRGDYDQNSEVNIGDLSALGANLDKSTASPDWESKARAADGDGNSLVSISDITPLGSSLMASVEAYSIESTQTPAVEVSWSELAHVDFDAGTIPAGSALRTFAHTLAPATGVTSFRVRPISDGELGPPSNVVQWNNVPPQPPVIDGVTGTTGEEGASVQLIAQLSGGAPATYSWIFGGAADPDTSTSAVPFITLGSAGVYDASLTVANAAGSDTYDFQISVTPVVISPDITDVSPPSGTLGEEVQFFSQVNGSEPDSYAWDFGGGATPNASTEQFPIVTLGAIGVYQMSLTVMNAAGSDTYEFDFSVGGGSAPPVIMGVVWTSSGEGTFSEFSASLMGGTPTEWLWTFNGAATPDPATEPQPLVTIGPQGTYQCELYVANEAGSDTYPFEFTSTPDGGGSAPSIFFVTPTVGVSGDNVEFVPGFNGSEPISWSWDFGGGAIPMTSQSETPDETLLEPGEYTVTVHAQNAYGSDDFEFKLTVTQ